MFHLCLSLLALSFLFNPASAAVQLKAPRKLTILTSVFGFEAPKAGEVDYQVLSTVDGRVYTVKASNEVAVSSLSLAFRTGAGVELVLEPGGNGIIASAEILAASRTDAFSLSNREADVARETRNRELRLDEGYSPTVLDSEDEAQALYDSVYSYDSGYDVSDHCYDRAHYWARSFDVDREVKSQKVFIFFTPKYRREHDYKWWFHVAPFVLTGSDEDEYVIDPTYTNGPLLLNDWAREFADYAESCSDSQVLGEYYTKGESEDCLLIRTSMFHYNPNDLNSNPSVTSWRCWDLRAVTTGIPAPYEKSSWDEVEGFLPAYCR